MVEFPEEPNSVEEERKLRNKVFQGMDLAVEGIQGYNGRDLTAVERLKLLHFAIEEFDLPLTHSYYLAGDIDLASSAKNTYRTESPVEPEPNRDLDEFEDNVDFKRSGVHRSVGDDVNEFKEYFQKAEFFEDCDLRTVIFQPGPEFLIDYYEAVLKAEDLEYADELGDLYIHSTRFRNALSEVIEDIQTGHQVTSIDDFKRSSSLGMISRERELHLRDLVSLMLMDLAAIEWLNETRDSVRKGTTFIEKVLKRLTTVSELSGEQIDAVASLESFFYDFVWKYPALHTSKRTARGPNADTLVAMRERQLATFEQELLAWTSIREGEFAELGLLPQPEDYATGDYTEAKTALHSLGRANIEDAWATEN